MSRRRRVRTAGRIRRQPAALLTLCLVAASGVLACGCGSGATAAQTAPPTASATAAPATPAPAGDASPSPRPSPQITAGPVPTAALGAVREFWRLLQERRYARARAAVAPSSPLADPGARWNLAGARLLAVYPRALAAVPPYATVEFKTVVSIRPSAGTNTWGAAGSRSLWMTVTRMSDRSWRVYEFGTGP